MGKPTRTYTERWADAINETYPEDALDTCVTDAAFDGESYEDAAKRVLTKAAQCLPNGIPATFTAGELDLVRHRMQRLSPFTGTGSLFGGSLFLFSTLLRRRWAP